MPTAYVHVNEDCSYSGIPYAEATSVGPSGIAPEIGTT